MLHRCVVGEPTDLEMLADGEAQPAPGSLEWASGEKGEVKRSHPATYACRHLSMHVMSCHALCMQRHPDLELTEGNGSRLQEQRHRLGRRTVCLLHYLVQRLLHHGLCHLHAFAGLAWLKVQISSLFCWTDKQERSVLPNASNAYI